MAAVSFLCAEYSRAQTVSDAAADSANSSGSGIGAVVWPQVRMEMRFLSTKNGQQSPEIDAKDIRVLDNGREVKGANIERDRTPLSICMVVDESGSLFDKSQLQVAAALTAIAAMQPGDEMAIVAFNNRAFLNQDFTNDTKKLELSLEKLKFWGPSNLFDTLTGTVNHVFNHSQNLSHIMLVLSDGGNNQSAFNLLQTVDQLSATDGPVVYSMTLRAEDENRQDFANLLTIAEATGGQAVKIESKEQNVTETIRALMREAHDRYIVVYTPVQQLKDGSLHKIEVKVGKLSESGTKVQAITRREYHAPAK